MKLNKQDLRMAILRLPKKLYHLMQEPLWNNKIFVAGGYISSVITNTPINDIDIFTTDMETVQSLVARLESLAGRKAYKTDNAYTIQLQGVTIQIIHRWLFSAPERVADSFDFTINCAVIYCGTDKINPLGNRFDSYRIGSYYEDLSAKRLVYRCPERNEDAGGSLLRVLKYYQKGYRIPLDSYANVIARMLRGIDFGKIFNLDNLGYSEDIEKRMGFVISGLLREVDPQIDPLHESHIPNAYELSITEEGENDIHIESN